MIFSYLLNMQSHPSWVCGLKHSLDNFNIDVYKSHPSWVCGLKLAICGYILLHPVTPFVGVWIETSNHHKRNKIAHVTPFVGVWIETTCRYLARSRLQVTPFVGVWIETSQGNGQSLGRSESHPSWVCGLKQMNFIKKIFGGMSHPSWVCGLKQFVLSGCAGL